MSYEQDIVNTLHRELTSYTICSAGVRKGLARTSIAGFRTGWVTVPTSASEQRHHPRPLWLCGCMYLRAYALKPQLIHKTCCEHCKRENCRLKPVQIAWL